MSAPDGRVYDHRPVRGPHDGRCVRCGRLVLAHAGVLRRWAWRMGWL